MVAAERAILAWMVLESQTVTTDGDDVAPTASIILYTRQLRQQQTMTEIKTFVNVTKLLQTMHKLCLKLLDRKTTKSTGLAID